MTLVKEIELNATRGQVWNMVATGPGLAAWYAPTALDPQLGGYAASDFGNNTVAEGVVVTYEPGERIVFGSERIAMERGRRPEKYTDARLEFRILSTVDDRTASRGDEILDLIGNVAHALRGTQPEAREARAVAARPAAPRTILQVRQDGFPDEGQETYEEGWEVYLHTLSQYFLYFAGLPVRATASLAMPPYDREAKFERITRALLNMSPDETHVGTRVSVTPAGRNEVLNGVIDICNDGGSCHVVGVRTDTALIRAAAGGDTCGAQLNRYEYISNPTALFDRREREVQVRSLRVESDDWQRWFDQVFA